MSADNLPPQDEAAVYGPEVAQPLRETADLAPVPDPAPPMTPPAMPPVDMPGMMPGMEPVTLPGMGGMGMDPGGMPMPSMPEMPGSPAPSGGAGAGEPGLSADASFDPSSGMVPAFNAPWLLALREDGPRAVLAFVTLPRYLKLLDALVAKAKAWPHLPADAPGRAQAPQTPAWEGALDAALRALGLNATSFTAQWQRLAMLRG